MKILVTGGIGFIGSHTILELVSNSHEVVIVDNLCNSDLRVLHTLEGLTSTPIKFYKADVRIFHELDKVFESHHFDAVIHFAGVKSVAESVAMPFRYYDDNFVGSYNLLYCMAKHSVYKMIFSSSATVYGESHRMPITEECTTNPLNPYGRTKLFVEEMCRDLFASDPKWSFALLRYFNPVGAHSSGLIGENPKGTPNNLFPVVSRVACGQIKKLLIFGEDYPTIDGTGVRDYIHVEDLALGHVKALEYVNQHNGAEIFNLGTGIGYSVRQVIDSFAKVNGISIPYEVVGRRAGDMAQCYADPSKALQVLHWEAKKNLDDMCRDSWRYQQMTGMQLSGV